METDYRQQIEILMHKVGTLESRAYIPLADINESALKIIEESGKNGHYRNAFAILAKGCRKNSTSRNGPLFKRYQENTLEELKGLFFLN